MRNNAPTESKPMVSATVRADIRDLATCLMYIRQEQGIRPQSFAQLYGQVVETLAETVRQLKPEYAFNDVESAYLYYQANIGKAPPTRVSGLAETLVNVKDPTLSGTADLEEEAKRIFQAMETTKVLECGTLEPTDLTDD